MLIERSSLSLLPIENWCNKSFFPPKRKKKNNFSFTRFSSSSFFCHRRYQGRQVRRMKEEKRQGVLFKKRKKKTSFSSSVLWKIYAASAHDWEFCGWMIFWELLRMIFLCYGWVRAHTEGKKNNTKIYAREWVKNRKFVIKSERQRATKWEREFWGGKSVHTLEG